MTAPETGRSVYAAQSGSVSSTATTLPCPGRAGSLCGASPPRFWLDDLPNRTPFCPESIGQDAATRFSIITLSLPCGEKLLAKCGMNYRMSELGEATGEVLGHHLIADMTGLSLSLLRDGDRIMRMLNEALAEAGFHSIRSVEHHFVKRGAGFTGMVLLEESHAAVHTYPEHEYLALDIFACGNIDPSTVMDTLVSELDPVAVDIRRLTRTPRVGIFADRNPQ